MQRPFYIGALIRGLVFGAAYVAIAVVGYYALKEFIAPAGYEIVLEKK